MKITKFVHSCLLVETPERTALFDPGVFSTDALKVEDIQTLHDIFITHEHGDHIDMDLVQALVKKFPEVRITSTAPVVASLKELGIEASPTAPEGAQFFNSPHEDVEPLFPRPLEIGVHFLDQLTHPGDSHSFTETRAVLALPVTAPWGSTVRAVNLALELHPQYIVPIHDWHWNDAARDNMYGNLEQAFAQKEIKFLKPETGKPIEIDL